MIRGDLDVNMYFRLKSQMLQHQQFTYTVTGHYQHFSSEPEEWFEVDGNDDDETDPDWTPAALVV
jgi:hypothetical protein